MNDHHVVRVRTLGKLFTPLTALGVVLAVLLTGAPASAEPSIEEMERKIEKFAADLTKVVEDYNRARDELDETKAKAAKLAKKMAPLQAKADKIYSKVGEISAVVYKGGRVSAANALLTSGSPRTLIDQLSTLDRLASEQSKGLDALKRVTAKLDREKADIDSVLDDQRRIERDLVARKKKIKKDIDKLQEMRRRAYGDRAARDGRRPGYIPPYIPGKPGKVVRYAQAQLGDPYVFAADGPDSFDCSGLTLASWRVVGVSLPHSSKKQYYNTQRVSRDDLAPGDLVFYYSDIHHVGIYVGEGWVIHAPEPGRNVEQVRYDAYSIYGYGRPG